MPAVTKTISVKLHDLTKTKLEALQDLLNISADLSRYYVTKLETLNTQSKKALHNETYTEVKSMFPGLPTGLIQTIRDKSLEAYKSYKARVNKGKKASLPVFKHSVVRFDSRTFTLHKTETCFPYFVSVSTRQKRVMLPVKYGRFQGEILAGLASGVYKFCTAELSFSYRLNCYILNISYKYDVPEQATTAVMGIDLGITNLAVLAVPGQIIKFFNGKRHNQKRDHYAELRRKLGKKKLIKKIKAIGNKEQRYMKDVNHKISRQIVNIAKQCNAVIQLEDLSNIRERAKFSHKMNRKLHNWNFHQLRSFIEYKAIAEGLKVVQVSPKYTSQGCHICGHTEKGNRPNQATFLCKACGYQANADFNASMNIAVAG
ncbi:transposase, IS605 OrfB family [Desulforamulus reducens MI-1]|uniref:Transposase, IS605 OrfB family n=1 Tax=Desulforamulus reducens (strain ATCC BAA-1160 / DSM 100696 / MI-1) TaxID=349161 RepID=A4J2W1_DESRM|nr:RNA-guided endonuclease TnpB family protein [Desulforamulus reducens]ABO49414.1 transposase, IS605 OrfB family [Desulforamulus reducens MI-1]